MWGAVLTMVLFAYVRRRYVLRLEVREIGALLRFSPLPQCKYFGTFMDIFSVLFCFLVGIVMTSGSGAMFEQYFGIPAVAGSHEGGAYRLG